MVDAAISLHSPSSQLRDGSRSSTSSDSLRPTDTREHLCTAMGSLLLRHRVETLQQEVDDLRAKKEAMGGKSHGHGMGRGRGRGGHHRHHRHEGSSLPHPSHDRHGSPSEHPEHSVHRIQNDRSLEAEGDTRTRQADRVIVVDASVLVYSLRSVHEWLKEGTSMVVIPEEALCTLDVLKKGDELVNLAARRAARYLEDRMEGMQSDSSLPNVPLPTGLWSQSEKARMSLDAIEAPERSFRSEEQPLRTAPLPVRETLLCALWYRDMVSKRQGVPSLEGMSLAIALPSASPDLVALQADQFGEGHAASVYQERVDGKELLHWAERYGFGQQQDQVEAEQARVGRIIVTPIARSWLDGEGHHGPRGGGRGGRGHHMGRGRGKSHHHEHHDDQNRRGRGGRGPHGHHHHHPESLPRLS